MISNVPSDWVTWSKLTFKTDKIPLYLIVAGATAMLIQTDNSTWRASDRWYKNDKFIRGLSDDLVSVGDGKSQFGLGVAFALYGLIGNDNKALITGSEVIQSVLSSGSVVQVLKHVTGRESPFVSTRDRGRWDFFPDQIEYHKHVPCFDAFPSGHLTTTVATFTVIIENYPDVKWLVPAAVVLTTGLGISMVNTGIHWYSDYPLAIALGYTFGVIAAHPGKLPLSILADNHISIMPSVNQNFDGISLSYQW